MVALTKDNFEQEVISTNGLIMVDFWNEKCEPCKALMPKVHELAEKYQGKVKFCTLDTKGNRRLAMAQKVLGLPTIQFYQNGEVVAELSNEIAIEDVESKLIELT
ncbi:thioredoxin domain-containing protein [Desulfosporosinus orientis DSM 765]|uniref:Thioredoxin n=1 Tax=Desulfosporosinus orientis (strain ATCC 19365 / DSM 765 / NCIMB 8382 / VKM B-1628 / Singapore I) TaxID=768706 RepID=G7WBH0_DESOD|nr:thioredoxin domain-containing protein [Desulfosporosinus orientis]AET68299.1 thioredoxin domain-containing protein [Desulfosporosinus orientis DSM 765]